MGLGDGALEAVVTAVPSAAASGATGAAPFDGFFAGRRVFVTGHTGFKGAWLSFWLRRLGAEVTGYALDPPTTPDLFTDLRLGDEVHDGRGDVRDAAALAAALVAAEPEVVFHLAAQALVRASYAQPVDTYATNVMGTVHLLEALRDVRGVRAAVVVTSDKCYENPEDGRAFREGDPMGGRDPYSSSKGCAELVTAAYRASFFSAAAPAVASVRAGNVIGGGDWGEDRLLPDCARAIAGGTAPAVRNPAAVRPWQYVLEPLAGYLWLAVRLCADGGAYAGAWNFGPGAGGEASVREVVETFLAEWGGATWRDAASPGAPHEAATLRLDSAAAAEGLGWRTVCDLPEALRATARWYRRRQEGADMVAASASAIDDYVATARAAGLRWAAGAMPGART